MQRKLKRLLSTIASKIFNSKGKIDHPTLKAILDVDDSKYLLRRCKENLDVMIGEPKNEGIESVIILLAIYLLRKDQDGNRSDAD